MKNKWIFGKYPWKKVFKQLQKTKKQKPETMFKAVVTM